MKSKTGAYIWSILALLLILIGLFKINNDLHIESNILKLLPITESEPITEEAFNKFSDKNMQLLIFLVANPDIALAKQSATELAEKIQNSPYIEDVVLNVSPEEQKKLGIFNFTYRHHLMMISDKKKLQENDFEDFTDTVIQQVYSPFSGGLIELIQQDPFLLSYRFSLGSNTTAFQNISMEDGYLLVVSEAKKYILVTAKLSHSPFDPKVQNQLISSINLLEQQWQQQSGSELIRTGALFFGNFAYQSAHAEVTTIGYGSLLLIVGLLVIVFQSVRPIFLIGLALAFGVASGFTAVHLLFGSVHILTIVFGASLIGVAVDYGFHYLATADIEKGSVRLKKIFPAISLGLASSIIGYMALLTTPFPGLQQMAVFCISGLAAAYLTVVLLFPVIPVKNKTPIFILSICQQFLVFGKTKFARLVWVILLALPFIAALFIYSQPAGNDNIRLLQPKNPVLQGQADEIQSALSSPAANQFYLIKESSIEKLLIKVEQTSLKLDSLVDEGVIDSYLSITHWLPSEHSQQQNYQLYQKLYNSGSLSTLTSYGLLNESESSRLQEIFKADKDNILSVDVWLKSVAGKQFSSLWLGKINEQYAAVIAIKGINQLQALSSFDENSLFVDKVSKISNLFKVYRESTTGLLLIAIIFIFMILWFRYDYKRAFLITSSPVISISVAMIGILILGESVNLFNTLAMFLVIGIGIDYGLFFAESDRATARTVLAIVMSALTTIFTFGLLSLSDTAAIHAFGLTMLLGISSTFLLSPIIGNLLVSLKAEKS